MLKVFRAQRSDRFDGFIDQLCGGVAGNAQLELRPGGEAVFAGYDQL